MEESDDGTLKLGPSTRVDGSGRECFPDNVFANVGSDKERDTGSETVTLGQELIEKHDNEGCGDELEDEQEADTGTERGRRAVKSSQDVDGSLSERNDESKD